MAYRNYAPSNGFLVDKFGNGDFKTIQAAITAATSGTVIFINPGTYTENLTLKNNVNLFTYGNGLRAGGTGTIIVGKMIDNGVSVGCLIYGITLQTNSDFVVSLSGGSSVQLTSCFVNARNNTAFTMANASDNIYFYNSYMDLATTGISFVSQSNGDLWIRNSTIGNSGASTTATTISSGIVIITNSKIDAPIACTSTGLLNLYYSQLESITTAGSSTHEIFECSISSGASSAITVGVGTTVKAVNNVINSSAVNVFTGAGTINTGGNTCVGSGSGNNVATINHLTVI